MLLSSLLINRRSYILTKLTSESKELYLITQEFAIDGRKSYKIIVHRHGCLISVPVPVGSMPSCVAVLSCREAAQELIYSFKLMGKAYQEDRFMHYVIYTVPEWQHKYERS